LTKSAEAVARYVSDPNTDFHALAATITRLERAAAKTINFGKIYGIGVKSFAIQLGKPLGEAQQIYQQYDRELPFISQLDKIYRRQAHRQGYIALYDAARRHFNRWAEANGRRKPGLVSWKRPGHGLEIQIIPGTDAGRSIVLTPAPR
jgi:hypothetical protein